MGIETRVFRGGPEGKIEKSTVQKEDLKNDEVLVKVTHSGLCGTDMHFLNSGIVLGHEGAGVIEAVAPGVEVFKKGDRVGFGYVFKSCGHCQYCLSGNDNYCPDRQMYGFHNHDKGSMSDYTVWPAGFLYAIPDAMTSEDAAPLMCGGATVYNALSTYGVRPSDRVGIVGVGGLGHLAIQFAAKMGCEVVVFSTTEDKKAEAEKFGATEFYATKGKTELKGVKPIQHLIVTTAVQPDWTIFISVLAPRATIFPLGASAADLKFPYMPFFFKGFTIQGSLVAPRHTHREMLEFAAAHGIKPVLQKFPMDVEGIEKAIETLKAGSMRYRGVLVAP